VKRGGGGRGKKSHSTADNKSLNLGLSAFIVKIFTKKRGRGRRLLELSNMGGVFHGGGVDGETIPTGRLKKKRRTKLA